MTTCPPNPTAKCSMCGDELQEHTGSRNRCAQLVSTFRPADLNDLETCPESMSCNVCGEMVCPVHDPKAGPCGDNPHDYHHDGCHDRCRDCDDVDRYSRQEHGR